MVRKKVVDYVKSLLSKGYSASAIKSNMIKYGYSSKEVDEAISDVYNPAIRHEIHLSAPVIFVIIFIVISAISVIVYMNYEKPQAAEQLLDVNLEPVLTTVQAGDNIVFLKEILNLGSAQRYDIVVKQEVIDPKTNRVLTQKIETRAIETTGSTQTRILIPKETLAGDYLLRMVVEYDNKKAIATLPLKVVASDVKETCFDGARNQNEEGIDCGGICKACQEQAINCNDNDICTNDAFDNGKCLNVPIVPCCGNYVCEEQESCASDCQDDIPYDYGSVTLDEIKELAKTNPSKALQECNNIEVPDLKDACISSIGEVQQDQEYCAEITGLRAKDLCYSNIAHSTADRSLCELVASEGRRDSCYMTLVLEHEDYSVCGSITNKQLRDSCDLRRQLSEIQQGQNSTG